MHVYMYDLSIFKQIVNIVLRLCNYKGRNVKITEVVVDVIGLYSWILNYRLFVSIKRTSFPPQKIWGNF